jgi:hypothetical protein
MMSGQVSSPNIPGIIAEAKRSERERIIKLLEEELVEFKHIPTDVHGNFRLTLGCLIPLIKGENK